jgi:hypothetical protein
LKHSLVSDLFFSNSLYGHIASFVVLEIVSINLLSNFIFQFKNTHTHKLLISFAKNVHTSLLLVFVASDRFKNIKYDFSLSHHFHCIIAAITFAQIGASSDVHAIL